ncbi:hypothetical protein HOLleu_11755 [Holothuria leucospilota]|uniref:Tyr recombinase domain-containing protein n=1 Tax=Holothuria leucospilota TaxID=206669 RepID=A0A9Q1HDC8_HOLLE|nr:hypothetical protein HOLleu_11755 [Holothuria leucospilota]
MLQIIRESIKDYGFSAKTADIILSSRRESTTKQYSITLRNGWIFVINKRQIHCMHSNPRVRDFFTSLYENIGYSALNTARAAISSLVSLTDGYTVGNHPLITRYFKGVFNLKPRYNQTWDVRLVLNYLRKLSLANKLGLKDLTLKTLMLLALVSSQRQQTLHKLDVRKMELKVNKVIFFVEDLLKHNRPGNTGLKLEFCSYPPDRRLCIHTYLMEYLKRTKKCRGRETSLLVSYGKPFSKVSTSTIARWLRTVMHNAGVDVTVFKPHSIRSATVSRASAANVPVLDILSHAGWKNEQTFQRFYNKPVGKDCKQSVATAILGN